MSHRLIFHHGASRTIKKKIAMAATRCYHGAMWLVELIIVELCKLVGAAVVVCIAAVMACILLWPVVWFALWVKRTFFKPPPPPPDAIQRALALIAREQEEEKKKKSP